jgi:hypothetical protein
MIFLLPVISFSLIHIYLIYFFFFLRAFNINIVVDVYVNQIYDLNETRNTLHASSTSKPSNRRFSYSLNIIVAMDCSMTIFCSTTSNTISFIMIKDNMIIDGFFNNRFVDDNRFIIDRFINWIFFANDNRFIIVRIARLLKNKNVLS